MLRSVIMLSLLAFAAAPAAASSYSAKVANSVEGRIIAPDMSWSCGSGTCQGTTEESRPTVLCEALAKRTGRIESFVVDGRTFSAAELDKCNASAKTDPGKALAAQ